MFTGYRACFRDQVSVVVDAKLEPTPKRASDRDFEHDMLSSNNVPSLIDINSKELPRHLVINFPLSFRILKSTTLAHMTSNNHRDALISLRVKKSRPSTPQYSL